MNTHLPNTSLSLSMMVSEAAFRVITGVEQVALFGGRLLRIKA